MIFADIANGESVFLDANTYVYQFCPDPLFGPACTDLFQRIERQEIRGYTSTHVISEMAHRMMTIEATVVFGWPFSGIANRLRRHAADISRLSGFRRAVELALNSNVEVLTILPQLTLDGTIISQSTGLLTNDALVVAVMQSNGITNLASNDADFDRVPGIKRFSPT